MYVERLTSANALADATEATNVTLQGQLERLQREAAMLRRRDDSLREHGNSSSGNSSSGSSSSSNLGDMQVADLMKQNVTLEVCPVCHMCIMNHRYLNNRHTDRTPRQPGPLSAAVRRRAG